MSRREHANIALFVAHVGCPQRCTFCNQNVITGAPQTAQPEDVAEAVRTALASGTRGAQLAFFGGSFTAVDRNYMVSLLEAARPFVEDGSVSGIRCSTRPDAIDESVLELLKKYNVEAVELGAQSMDDRVLAMNRRGHTEDDVRRASALIHSFGMELGLQMMTGLYGDTDEGAMRTADELISLQPATVRIYPTVVLEGTELARLYAAGTYRPQTLPEAVSLCAALLPKFTDNGIRVIRLGLHSGGNVEDGYLAGAYHPAFRELVEGELYLQKVEELMKGLPEGEYTLYVKPSEISKITGQKRKNILKLKEHGYDCKVKGNAELEPFEVIAAVNK